MDATSMRRRSVARSLLNWFEWEAAAVWLLGFSLVAYLGLEGGGYDPIVRDQVGIVVWWVLLAGVAVGALPRLRPGALAWSALGLFAAFAVWIALSLTWTESAERTLAEAARVAGYLGVFALALFARGSEGGRRLAAGVAAGIVVVAAVALLSRFHPAWFPEADQAARFLESNRERLSYPLHYWNGLAALLAIGFPLLLYLATEARSIASRALACAALPALVLASFLTLSRGGIGAAAIAAAIFLVFAADRLPKLLALLVAGAGGAALCLAVAGRESLRDGLLGATAEAQGEEMLVLTLLACLAVGAVWAGLSLALAEGRRPGWSFASRRFSVVATATALVVALVALAALDAPGRAGDAWGEFKRAESPGEGGERLFSAAGQSRYDYWRSAVDQNATRPLTGTGSGTFEYWWSRNRNSAEAIVDAHSLYLQTLGELGIVGLALLAAFLLAVLVGGGREAVRAGPGERSLLAAALAGVLAFFLTAIVDWTWQIAVLPVAMLLLAAILVSSRSATGGAGRSAGLPVPQRAAVALVAVAAIVAIAIPLTSASLLRQSEDEARAGDLIGALEAARSAESAHPGAAAPRLRQALLLEELGDLDAAAAAARAATERERTNWRNWLVLSRVAAQRGDAGESVRAYRTAESLNPRSPLFDR